MAKRRKSSSKGKSKGKFKQTLYKDEKKKSVKLYEKQNWWGENYVEKRKGKSKSPKQSLFKKGGKKVGKSDKGKKISGPVAWW